MLIDLFGFLLPLEWLIGIILGFIALIVVIVLLFLFRKTQKIPEKKNLVLMQKVDEHKTIQVGDLLNLVRRDEHNLYIQRPGLVDDEENPITIEVNIDDIVPLMFRDSDGTPVDEWIVKEKDGNYEAVSASVIMFGAPERYDPLPADPRPVSRLFTGWSWMGAKSLGETLVTKTGIAVVFFVFVFGLFTAFLIEAVRHGGL